MKNLKRMMSIPLLGLLCGCVGDVMPEEVAGNAVAESGCLTVSVKYERTALKSIADYQSPTAEESEVFRLDVLVFDAVSGRLERSACLSSLSENCSFEIPVGTKKVYAVANCPDLSRVQSVVQMMLCSENLAERNYLTQGFVMMGYQECVVSSGVVSEHEIVLRRLVSRVELRSIRCNVASQYGGMKVESVFLGNANSVQSLSGQISSRVNVGGYADADKACPVGLDGVSGNCPAYMFRQPGFTLNVGETSSQPVYLYCHPADDAPLTCLYILASVADEKYYYRVQLDKGLAANTTYVIDAVITNLGAPLPPDDDIQKGEITVNVHVEDWLIGDVYHAEF